MMYYPECYTLFNYENAVPNASVVLEFSNGRTLNFFGNILADASDYYAAMFGSTMCEAATRRISMIASGFSITAYNLVLNIVDDVVCGTFGKLRRPKNLINWRNENLIEVICIAHAHSLDCVLKECALRVVAHPKLEYLQIVETMLPDVYDELLKRLASEDKLENQPWEVYVDALRITKGNIQAMIFRQLYAAGHGDKVNTDVVRDINVTRSVDDWIKFLENIGDHNPLALRIGAELLMLIIEGTVTPYERHMRLAERILDNFGRNVGAKK